MTDLTEQAKAAVMVRENLSAYYFSFETTGNTEIDRILGAVAWAGKAYHHTEDWDNDDLGLSCVDNIQNAANLAAATLETLTQENARLKAVSDDHFRNAQRLAGEVAKRDVENARLREALEAIAADRFGVRHDRLWEVSLERRDIARKALGGGDE